MTANRVLRPLSAARRRLFSDLSTRSGRERHGLFLLEGPRAIEDALARGARIVHLVVAAPMEEAVTAWLASGIVGGDVQLHRAGREVLARLADTATPQGVLAIGQLPDLSGEALPPDPGALTLLADGLQDPGNLGTLLRTLVAVGGRAALCARGTVDPFNPKALRAAAGATFNLSLAVGLEAGDALAWCGERGVEVVALEAGAPSLFESSPPPGPVALAVGNEGGGLSAAVRSAASRLAGLPMARGVESLSVAVAGSIALYVLAHRLAPPRDA